MVATHIPPKSAALVVALIRRMNGARKYAMLVVSSIYDDSCKSRKRLSKTWFSQARCGIIHPGSVN